MKIATIIVRILLGVLFAVLGSNPFLHFIPMPPMSGPAGDFIGAMNVTGYLMGVGACQVIGGVLLIVGRFVPLGLVFIGPVIVNIVLYHICMDHSGIGLAAVVSILFLFLLWAYRSAFTPLFRP